jgi:hypothetical protein
MAGPIHMCRPKPPPRTLGDAKHLGDAGNAVFGLNHVGLANCSREIGMEVGGDAAGNWVAAALQRAPPIHNSPWACTEATHRPRSSRSTAARCMVSLPGISCVKTASCVWRDLAKIDG